MDPDYFTLRAESLIGEAGLETFFSADHLATQCQAARRTFEQERLAGCDVLLSIERAEAVLLETLQTPLTLSSLLKFLLTDDFPEYPELLSAPHFSELLRRTAPYLASEKRRLDAIATAIVIDYVESVLPA